ncbi:MAG: tetratricopeptide repeat protein [Candidatus Binataceae bacterium]
MESFERTMAGPAARLCMGVLALALGALGIIAAAAAPARAAAAVSARAQSDQIVTQAEAAIMAAGKSKPVDTAKIRHAMEQLNKALTIDPTNDSVYVDLGFCYGLLHDGPTAVKMYLHAVHLNPSPANFLELSDIYMRVGDPAHALMAAMGGISKAPNDARLYNAKGMALNDLKRPGDAADAFEKAIKIDPNFQIARDNLHDLNRGSSGRGSVAKH